MKQKVFIILIFATIVYILFVVSGIIMALSLEFILFKAIIGLLIVAGGSFVLICLMNNTSIEEQKHFKLESISTTQKVNNKEEAELEKEFVSLELPVVEIIETNDEGD